MGSRSSSVAPEYETCDAMLTKTEFIPLRLTFPQRKVQRQISSCIQVCDYTEKVDTPAMYEKPTKRVCSNSSCHSTQTRRGCIGLHDPPPFTQLQAQLRHAHNILRGLEVSSNVASKKKMLRDTCLADNANFFQQQLEYARR